MTTRKRAPKVSRKYPTRAILALNVKNLMEVRGYSQDALSERADKYGGISQKTISNILSQRHSVYLEQLDTLADTFGIAPSELISENYTPQ